MNYTCNKDYGDVECPGRRLADAYTQNEHRISSQHSYISPSNLHKYLRCPAAPAREWLVQKRNDFMCEYVNFFLKEGEDPTTRALVESIQETESEAVQDGTRLHAYLEYTCATNFEQFPKGDYDYRVMREELRNWEGISDDALDNRKLVEGFHDIVIYIKENCLNADWWCSEVWVPLQGFNSWGTADIVLGWDRTLEIFDLKTGRQEVSAEFNEQLLAYAVGALDVLGWENFDTVQLHIVGVRWKGNSWERTTEQVRNWKETYLAPKMKECYDFHPQAKPGEHCLYCKAKLFCREWVDIMYFRYKGGTFDDAGLKDMDSTTLIDRYLWSKQIERFQNSAKDEIALRFEGIDAIEDARVQYVKPPPIKKYLDEERAVSYIIEQVGDNKDYIRQVPRLTPDEFAEFAGDNAGEFVEVKGRRPYVKMA